MENARRNREAGGLYVLPGMGADRSMFRNDWLTLKDCTFLNWPRYAGEESLVAIADRIVSEAGIRDGSVVVGHSLGGMVACEIARIRNLKELVLMGSASRKEEVSALLSALHPLAAHTPFELIRSLAAQLPGELTSMISRSDPEFIRATCRAIFQWPGLSAKGIRPRRIHGRYDVVIPLPPHVDCVLEGGHMIPITHARECVAFVRSFL